MRITTNALIRNYKSNLGNSMSVLDLARTKVMTERQFSRAYENPTSALRASTLYQKYSKNQDYLSALDDVQSLQNAQEDAITQINSIATNLSKRYGVEALNGTNKSLDIRKTYAAAFREAQNSMVMSMNASYEDKFVFAGTDGGKPPFSLNADGTLLYRGVDISSADPAIQDLVKEFSSESVYIDLGFGLSIDSTTKEILSSSAFNTALPGINVIGFGQDANGNPQNMITLAGQIADILEAPDFDDAKFNELLCAFDEGRSRLIDNLTTIGTKTEFLTNTKSRLEAEALSLTNQINDVVHVDMAAAITEYSWAQYAYNAALKIGTSILSPSFIDFMK